MMAPREPRTAPTGEGTGAGNAAPKAEVRAMFDRISGVYDPLNLLISAFQEPRWRRHLVEATGFIMPDFVFCLLLGVVIRNATHFLPVKLSERSIDVVGEVALSLFLVMALMTMKLLDLANLAGPLLAILALQALLMIAFSVFVTYNLMGRNYDAAVISGGQVGFGLSSTACALAIMKAVTGRHGASALAFLIVPMVGAFFIDILNAMVIQGSLALPVFGFRP